MKWVNKLTEEYQEGFKDGYNQALEDYKCQIQYKQIREGNNSTELSGYDVLKLLARLVK